VSINFQQLIDLKDGNKTELTHAVTQTAMEWLLNNGFSLVVPEVPYGDSSYIADLMGWCEPNATERLKLHLCSEAFNRTLQKRHQEEHNIVYDRMIKENPKLRGANGYYKAMREVTITGETLSNLMGDVVIANVEVKTSRSDFTKDRHAKFASRYCTMDAIAYPNGMIKQEEIPAGWLGIETSKDGKRVYRIRAGNFTPYRMDDKTTALYLVRIFLRFKYWCDYKAQSQGLVFNTDARGKL